jgi:hypothetical protein
LRRGRPSPAGQRERERESGVVGGAASERATETKRKKVYKLIEMSNGRSERQGKSTEKKEKKNELQWAPEMGRSSERWVLILLNL